MNEPLPGPLERHLQDLARDVPPARDLWPGIAAQLGRSPRKRQPLALAAAAALAGACIAGTLTWAVMHSRAGVAEPPQRAAIFAEPRDAGYMSARATLEVGFRRQLAQLDPPTRARIEASLAVIRQAREEIREALANEPASPVLEQLWQSTLRDELDLYDRVTRGTETAVTRT